MKRDWFQILSNVALIVGVAIVIYELRLTRDFTEAEILTVEMSRISDRLLAKMGDAPMSALTKSVHSPEELTEEEIVVLDAYYNLITLNWISLTLTRELIGVGVSVGAEESVRMQARRNFSSEPGRRWLAHWSKTAEIPDIAAIALDEIGRTDESAFAGRYKAIRGK